MNDDVRRQSHGRTAAYKFGTRGKILVSDSDVEPQRRRFVDVDFGVLECTTSIALECVGVEARQVLRTKVTRHALHANELRVNDSRRVGKYGYGGKKHHNNSQ